MMLAGKIALITGGSTGMGAASTRLLASQGAHVWVVSELPVGKMQGICDEVASNGGRATAATCDITDYAAIARLFDRIEKEHGRLDILVNCAGVFHPGSAFEMDPSKVAQTFAVNVLGPIEMMRMAMLMMRRNGGGSIINITSAAHVLGVTTTAAYSASKAALSHYTRTVAPELRGTGIRVNAIGPGSVRTPMSGFSGSEGELTPERAASMKMRQAASNSPYGNAILEPEDIAQVVLFLASDAARAFHGAYLVADQGITGALNLGWYPPPDVD